MPRLLHMADVHLGARHRDLGDAATRQRERQFAAFRRGLDAGLAANVDVALISGDLFDKVGLGQWFRYFTGLLEVAGGIGLLISRYAFYAAVLLATVTVGAIIAHVTVLGSSPAAPPKMLEKPRRRA